MTKLKTFWLSVAALIALTVVNPPLKALDPPSPFSSYFNLVFPSGYGLNRVTVAASGDLVLGQRDHILAVDGSPGTVSNAGDGLVSIGPDGSMGAIVSVGNIQLGPNVSASSAQTSGAVELSPGDTVGSIQQGVNLTPLSQRVVRVSILPTAAPNPDVFVRPNSSINLLPGRYGTVNVGPGSFITVSAGTYKIDDFEIGADATLQLDTSGGSVNIYADNTASWKGRIMGDASQFAFAFLGHGSLVLQSAFRGTVLVPFGTLQLQPSSTAYEGTYYAKHVIVWPNVTIKELPTPFLLGGVSVSNTTPCIGETTEVSADISDAVPGATAWIQGVVGNRQLVQFSGGPGPRLIWASVYTPDGRSDFMSVPVTAQNCATQPGSAAPIALHFWGALKKPNVVEFVVHNYDSYGHEVPAQGSAGYTWLFGDGQTETTSSPFTSHDYSAAIDPLAQYNYFEVSVATGASTTKKIVPIWDLYAKNRANGIVQPPSTLTVSSSNLAIAITNYEHTSISLTQAIVELIPCDPALDSRPQAPQALSTSIAARATGNINIAAPKSIGRDVCIIGAHVMGDAPAGRVYTDVYTTLKENPILVEAVTDTWTVALLNQASRLTHDPNRFDEFELRQLYAAGLISTLPASDPPPSGTGVGTPAADPSVGQACTPGDTDNSIQGLICSPTSGWVFVGPEILNGFKGNFIMDHGCGTIGQLLSSVHQLFSHTSTIVKNRVEVRHSTDSGDRIDDSVSLLSLKLDSNTLKYGYPGTAGPNQTYTIDQMVNQYTVTDPDDSNKVWTMGGELNPNPSQCTADTTAILPLVVRPAPDAPASLLQRVASVADHTNIDGHYRFFSYSRADELLSGSGWANGTVSTVCSSFDRLAAVNAGLSLHPTLQVPGVPDGMRQYSSEERTTGGNELFVADYNKVESKCNDSTDHIWFLQGLCDDLASNVANQVNNCFANDGCDDTSNAWQNPGVGIAVSPDDMLDWDTWHTGGTYGYNEPLVYQPKGYRHAYLWTASPGSGSLTIEVVDTNNHPFANATILVNTNAVGTTNSSGTFDIPIIPAGTYDIGAQFDPCAAQAHPNNCKLPLEQADKTVVLPKNGSITVSLVLCAGPGGTNCPQPGTKPTLNVGITETQTGPDVCFTGSGYTPSAPVQITYSNVPGRTVDTIRNFASESSGNLNVIDTTWDDYQDQYCSASQLDAQVTITALDNVSNLSVQAMVPAAYWCSQAVVGTNFNGGCH